MNSHSSDYLPTYLLFTTYNSSLQLSPGCGIFMSAMFCSVSNNAIYDRRRCVCMCSLCWKKGIYSVFDLDADNYFKTNANAMKYISNGLNPFWKRINQQQAKHYFSRRIGVFLNLLSALRFTELQVTFALGFQEGCHCKTHWSLYLADCCASWNQLDFCCGCGPPLGLACPQAWLCLLSCKVGHWALSMKQNGGAQC